MGAEVVRRESWGTWEELLLGGAVLRHGTRNWDLVSAELQARTVSPFIFTSEMCKAKYEDLQQRYSGCIALFDELRKQRMAELRKALEVSEDSIGSLESKLESLKSDRNDDSRTSHESSHTATPMPCEKFDRVDSYSKETSKDGLSASSYTQENRPNLSHDCRIPASDSLEDYEFRQECAVSPNQEKVTIMDRLANAIWIGPVVTVKKRRGKRKRKDCSKDVKEGSIGETEFWGSADVVSASCCKENSASCSGQIAEGRSADDQCRVSNKDESAEIREIFDSIAENKCASVFRRRLDSQKRGRFKRMILQHMDFDTMRSRIANRSITSVKELFRDLLLLANNGLVFYSKTTREYKSALLLRSIVAKSLREHLKNYISEATITLLSTTPTLNPPVKAHIVHPAGKWKTPVGKAKTRKLVQRTPNAVERTGNARSPPSAESLAVVKKGSGSGRPRKAGIRNATQGADQKPAKGRKRSRAK